MARPGLTWPWRLGFLALLAAALPLAAHARTPVQVRLDEDLSGPIRPGEHIIVPRLPLDDGSTVSLDLEAFEVFAPDAAIIEYTDKGPRRLAPPADRYFRGTVIGDLDSLVVLASGPKLRGFVFTQEKVYAIAPDSDVYADERPDPNARLRLLDPVNDRPPGMPAFRCDADLLPPPGGAMAAVAEGMPMVAQPFSTSTVYTIKLALETDYELYQLFGSNTSSELRFIGDLTAAASAIYWRDVKTVFQIGTVHLWSTSSDPWTATTTSTALSELLSYWNANYTSVSRTIVHMLSGKNMGGGIAYIGVLCNSNFGYGLSSSLSTSFSTTTPSLYWDILCYTHEIGHNFDSPHTHCYSPPVDHCWNTEAGCYSGTLCSSGTSDPCNIGTIMSYCHQRSGGYSNINMYFSKASLTVPSGCQPSQAVTDQMRGYVESMASCLLPLAAAPTVTGINPNFGSTAGGTPVTVSGTGFQSLATVTIGGVAATGVTVVNSGSITATTGAHSAAVVDVVVQNPDSQSGTLAGGYSYGACGSPPVPVLTAPGGVANGVGYAVSWTATSSDNTYDLQESTDPGFAGAGTTAVTGTSQSFSHSVASTTVYYYRVRARVMCGGSPYTSGWSGVGQTVVNGPPVGYDYYTVSPCRLADTRGNGFSGQYGPPSLPNSTRDFVVGGQCGVPANAAAVVLNVTILDMTTGGDIRVYPAGGVMPLVSTQNWVGGTGAIANWAIVPLGTGGAVTVKVDGLGTIDVIIDVSGYFQ